MAIDRDKIVKDFGDAFNSHDVKELVSFFTDDAVYEGPGIPVKKGKQEIEEYFNGFFTGFPDSRAERRDYFFINDRICVEWTMNGTHSGDIPNLPATGRSFSINGVSINKLKGDKISQFIDYFDNATLLQQLGALPAMTEAK